MLLAINAAISAWYYLRLVALMFLRAAGNRTEADANRLGAMAGGRRLCRRYNRNIRLAAVVVGQRSLERRRVSWNRRLLPPFLAATLGLNLDLRQGPGARFSSLGRSIPSASAANSTRIRLSAWVYGFNGQVLAVPTVAAIVC